MTDPGGLDGAGATAGGNPAAVRVIGVSKTFGATRALDDVSLELPKGQIHALVGGNGSGKSTLVKILAGVISADAGELEVGGKQQDSRSVTPGWAAGAGLRFVHQQNSTFATLSVAENLALGSGFTGSAARISWRQQNRHAAEVLERFDIDARPEWPLARLSAARQMMVAIARALQDQEGASDGVLVLDEPTASLPEAEVRHLLDALTRFAAAGQTIMYISHRLEEIVEIAAGATVLRDGKVVAGLERGDLDHDRLVEDIMGRPVEALEEIAADRPPGESVLSVSGLRAGTVVDASLDLHGGEIVGVCGLLGSGRSSLLRVLFGAQRAEAGEIRIGGEAVRLREPRDGVRAGVAYLPEDRLREAAFPEMSVLENITIASVGEHWRGWRLDLRRERKDARGSMRDYVVKAQSPGARLTSLSGGNQQKVMLARWMRRRPQVLLLDEPTQGVDVGARMDIYRLVREAVEAGAGALVVSSDFDELATLCNRVIVLVRGVTVAEVSGGQLTGEQLGQLAFGTEVRAA